MSAPNTDPSDRLTAAPNIWLATVRPDGRPHLVPIWFVVVDGRWYICTAPDSVKARNLRANPQVMAALEDGNQPYVIEGVAQPVTPSPAVLQSFQAKYDWALDTDAHYTQVFEITVTRQVMGK